MNCKLVALMLSLGACTPASDNFRVMRRVVFVNGITDKYLLSIEGLCSITKDAQLEVTCKTGDGEYKKHYLGISDNVTCFVEQMDPASVDTYHYKVQFRPDVDVQVSELFIPFGGVLIDTEGNRLLRSMSPLDVLLSSGMSKEDWMVLV